MLMFNTGPQHGEGIGEYRGNPLYHASPSSGEYQNLIRQSGFETIDHVVDDRMPMTHGLALHVRRG